MFVYPVLSPFSPKQSAIILNAYNGSAHDSVNYYVLIYQLWDMDKLLHLFVSQFP